MHGASTEERLLADLRGILQRLDAIPAPIAAAYVDSAIRALCGQCNLPLASSISD